MQAAIRLAIDGVNAGRGGPFGAVVVQGDRIVGRGCNCVTSTNDPTAHAEVMAIRDACRTLDSFYLAGCEIYASCQPCPMCLAAIYWARFKTVYYGNTRKDAAGIDFDDDFIYEEIKRPVGRRKIPMKQLLRAEAMAAFKAWQAKTDRIAY